MFVALEAEDDVHSVASVCFSARNFRELAVSDLREGAVTE